VTTFAPALLPDAQKEILCRDLLTEFGITDIRQREDELKHACLVSNTHQDQERNPTASLNFVKLTYNCLGCNSHGGLLWFIATVRQCSSEQARQWIDKEAGTGGKVQDAAKFRQTLLAILDNKKIPTPIPRYSPRVLEPWLKIHPYLTVGMPELNLKGRGLDVRVLQDFKIGWDSAADRIVLPHFWKGNLVGWQTRRIWADGSPKYLNTPDFPRESTIFNHRREHARGRLTIVESMMSVLAHEGRIPMEATFGAKITDKQLRLLSAYPEVVLFMDNDVAGWKATHILAEALGKTARVWIVVNPYAADPGDLPTEEVQRLIDTAVPYSAWRQPDPDMLVKWRG
jgi:hypothetical protein